MRAMALVKVAILGSRPSRSSGVVSLTISIRAASSAGVEPFSLIRWSILSIAFRVALREK